MKRLKIILSVLWWATVAGLAATGIYATAHPDAPSSVHLAQGFHLTLLVIGAPLGTVAWWVVDLLLENSHAISEAAAACIFAGVVGVVGYLQWFWLVPAIFDLALGGRRGAQLNLHS